jgi:hypothetical protein
VKGETRSNSRLVEGSSALSSQDPALTPLSRFLRYLLHRNNVTSTAFAFGKMDAYMEQLKNVNLTAANDVVSAFLNDSLLPFKEIVLGISWAIYLFEQYLCYRQHRNLANPKLGVPKLLTAYVTDEEHKKSKAYGLDKSRFAFVSSLFSQLQTTFVIQYNVLPYLWALSKEALQSVGLTGEREVSCFFVVGAHEWYISTP